MGQYFIIVNLDKKEYFVPTTLKLWEICANNSCRILPFLLRKSNEIGAGGDIKKEYKYAGRWAGDRIVVVGDYDSSGLYHTVKESKEYKDITEEAIKEFNDFIELDELKIPTYKYIKPDGIAVAKGES